MTEIGSIKAKLVMDSSDFSKKLDDARTKMKDTGSAANKLSEDMGAVQRASLAVGTAIITGLGAAATVSINFEAQMSRVKAIAGASEEEFKGLQDAALELSASTSKSASEIAIAFEDMAAKGFNATQIIAAMPGVIAAAEASGSDLALTADVVSSALNGFGLEAAEASRIADVLAKTANISAASMDDMGYAFKYVAPIAHSLGMDIEQVSAALALMINSGLDGSSAGTALRQTLLSLNAPAQEQEKLMKQLGFSMRDSSGNAKNLSQIIGELTDVTKNMTEAERVATLAKLVGAEASSGLISVMNSGVGKLNSFTKALEDSAGASKEAADIMKDNVKASFDEFLGSLESLGIKISEDMLPAFREIIKYGTNVVNALGEMDGANVKTGLAFAGTAAAIGLTVSSIGKLALALRGLMVSMGPAGWIVTGLSVLGGVIASTVVHQNKMSEVTLENANVMIEQRDALNANIEAYDSLSAKSKLSSEELARFVDISSLLNQTADPSVIKALKDEQSKLYESSGLSNAELDKLVQLNGDILKVVPESSTVLSEQGNVLLKNTDKAKEFNAQKAEMIRLDLEEQKAKAEANMDDYLTKEKNLQTEINNLKTAKIAFDIEEQEQAKKLEDLRTQYAEAKKNDDWTEQDRLQRTIDLEQGKLTSIRKQRAETAGLLLEKAEDLEKTQKQIGKLDEVKRKMVELELKQVGINAKKGEEIRSLDTELVKLQLKKKQLEDTTPAAQKNTDEYRRSVDAIQSQISKLETARSRINDIISSAGVMNSELAKSVNKSVVVKYSSTGRTEALPAYHAGGIVKRQPDKLHIGGLASQFASIPNHNEVDVRLLRNEMVLTEAQQANLMRMIDAGFTSNSGGGEFDEAKLNAIIRVLEKATERPIVLKTDLNGREIAHEIYSDISELMEFDMRQKLTFRGMKY